MRSLLFLFLLPALSFSDQIYAGIHGAGSYSCSGSTGEANFIFTGSSQNGDIYGQGQIESYSDCTGGLPVISSNYNYLGQIHGELNVSWEDGSAWYTSEQVPVFESAMLNSNFFEMTLNEGFDRQITIISELDWVNQQNQTFAFGPEPSTVGMGLVGLLAVGLGIRRRLFLSR